MKAPTVIGLRSADRHAEILQANYQRYFSEALITSMNAPTSAVEALWCADFAIVSHGVEADPIFNFANQTALELFELSFCMFTTLPSRKSAETVSQTERDTLLAEVSKNGCIENYTGVRVSSTGKRFFIENARVWNLYDSNADYYGQAAMFKSWKRLK